MLLETNNPICPNCKKSLKPDEDGGPEYFPDKFVHRDVCRDIDTLELYCIHKESGCAWEGTFGKLDDHLTECAYAVCDICNLRVFTDPEYHKCSSATSTDQLREGQGGGRTCPLVQLACTTGTSSEEALSGDTAVAECLQRLESTVNDLKTVVAANRLLKNRDFHLSVIENSNHNGTMVWKIPEFYQRMSTDAHQCEISIFSLPFYTGRYGYKMCLRLNILGDGVGKGNYMSLFFIIMRGEFDSILQWPFSHKVTFKLINQGGGRDVIEVLQPDPMSSSFRRPKSDMNIASGYLEFISHADLNNHNFIKDDNIVIQCVVDNSDTNCMID